MYYDEILNSFSLIVLAIVFGAQAIDYFTPLNNSLRQLAERIAQKAFNGVFVFKKKSLFNLNKLGSKKTFFEKFTKLAWIFSLVGVFGYEIYLVILQYLDWSKDPFSRMFLPPYQNIGYFLIYSLPKIAGSSLISLAFALFFFWAAKKLNDNSGGGFFETSELNIFKLAVFLAGYPGFLIYLIMLIILYFTFNLLMSIYHILVKKSSLKALPKFSLYLFWLPTAIFAIIITSWLKGAGLLYLFNL